MYVLYNYLISISSTTWRWPLSRPKHVVVPYVENTLYSTNKYRCVRPVHTLYISQTSTHTVHQSHQYTHCTSVRPVHTLYISYFIEHIGYDEPRDYVTYVVKLVPGDGFLYEPKHIARSDNTIMWLPIPPFYSIQFLSISCLPDAIRVGYLPIQIL